MQKRTTRQKQLIYNVAKARFDHPTADDIYLQARTLDSRISRGTVYRNLEHFAQTGELLQVKVPGADRYDNRLDLHIHIICRDCGLVCDVPLEYRYEIDSFVGEQTGFTVCRHRTVFEGLCPECHAKKQVGS